MIHKIFKFIVQDVNMLIYMYSQVINVYQPEMEDVYSDMLKRLLI